jgi:propanol-preferring alcohol dehydrogenase
MLLEKPRTPLLLRDVEKPRPAAGQLLVRVNACAVCRTDLHIVDGELAEPKLPLILGHQIVGRVEQVSDSDIRYSNFSVGDRVGIPWLGWTDGTCAYCRRIHRGRRALLFSFA